MSPLATYEPQTIGQIFWSLWWLWSAVILMPMFVSTWLYYKQTKMKREIKWILLELHVPRETRKSPRAMEQVLGTINTLGNYPGDFQEMYMDGEVTRWYSLEMVSFGGEVHFYIRAYAKQRGLIEAAFYSYYSDLEIEEVPDYTERFPHNLIEMDERGYNLWGSEMLLDKSSAYPIKSYLDFEAIDEDKQFDPISAFLEVLSKL
ncbi:MAG: hypothetical protein HY978_04770, partial [Candidatus Liptonbacteria bacterium]|nr:hypothetical protein [Candidatus Liptonbacteria bacterium]